MAADGVEGMFCSSDKVYRLEGRFRIGSPGWRDIGTGW